jgi:hypothetical protein
MRKEGKSMTRDDRIFGFASCWRYTMVPLSVRPKLEDYRTGNEDDNYCMRTEIIKSCPY